MASALRDASSDDDDFWLTPSRANNTGERRSESSSRADMDAMIYGKCLSVVREGRDSADDLRLSSRPNGARGAGATSISQRSRNAGGFVATPPPVRSYTNTYGTSGVPEVAESRESATNREGGPGNAINLTGGEDDAPRRAVRADPLPEHLFQELNTFPAPPTTAESDAKCAVCLCDIQEKDLIVSLPCLHRFHPTCVARYITRRSGSCPTCGASVLEGIWRARFSDDVEVVEP